VNLPQVDWFEDAPILTSALFLGREVAVIMTGVGALANRELLRGPADVEQGPNGGPPADLPRVTVRELALLVAIVALGLSLLFEIGPRSRLDRMLGQEIQVRESTDPR
jgi:hypothetical protein